MIPEEPKLPAVWFSAPIPPPTPPPSSQPSWSPALFISRPILWFSVFNFSFLFISGGFSLSAIFELSQVPQEHKLLRRISQECSVASAPFPANEFVLTGELMAHKRFSRVVRVCYRKSLTQRIGGPTIRNKDLCQGKIGFLQPYLSCWDQTDLTSGHLRAFIDFEILHTLLLTILSSSIFYYVAWTQSISLHESWRHLWRETNPS